MDIINSWLVENDEFLAALKADNAEKLNELNRKRHNNAGVSTCDNKTAFKSYEFNNEHDTPFTVDKSLPQAEEITPLENDQSAQREITTPRKQKSYFHGDYFPSPILVKHSKNRAALSCSLKKHNTSFNFDRRVLREAQVTPKRDEKFHTFLTQIKDLAQNGDRIFGQDNRAKRSVKF
jgi:hypothetical protein